MKKQFVCVAGAGQHRQGNPHNFLFFRVRCEKLPAFLQIDIHGGIVKRLRYQSVQFHHYSFRSLHHQMVQGMLFFLYRHAMCQKKRPGLR